MNAGPSGETEVCRECGYALEGIRAGRCPECGWRPGEPVSGRRRSAAAGLYFACLIAIVAWGVQHVLVPASKRSTVVLAIGMSMLSVVASSVVVRLLKTRDRLFGTIRVTCAVIAGLIGAGLGALAVLRPGGHQVLLYALALFNAGVAYVAATSKGVPVSAMEEGAET